MPEVVRDLSPSIEEAFTYLWQVDQGETKDRDSSRAEQIAAVHQYLHAPPNPTSSEGVILSAPPLVSPSTFRDH